MRVEIYVYSKINGASPKNFFKRSFEWQSAPPTIGVVIPLQSTHDGKGRLKPGVVTDVRIKDGLAKVKLGTETSPEDLREALVPDGWQEICC